MRVNYINYSVVVALFLFVGQAGAEVGLRSTASGSEGGLAVTGTVSDVISLDLTVQGGTSNHETVSVFGNDFGAGNFRIHSVKIEVIPAPGHGAL